MPYEICIRWHYGVEIINVDKIMQEGDTISTDDLWDGGDIVKYNAKVLKFSRRGAVCNAALQYRSDLQNDKLGIEFGLWGTSHIKWNVVTGKAQADWEDDNYPEWNGPGHPVRLFGGDEPTNTARQKGTVLVNLRPDQQLLRAYLKKVDGACVLTSETQLAALDAAHIVPVKKKGQETSNNAMLLRTDLHRLFDSGLFWFEINENEAAVRYHEGLGKSYRDLLSGKTLSGPTFERVKAALAHRLTLPDGRGLGGNGEG